MQISGCPASDFSSSTCSKACVEGLDAFSSKVKSACANKGITGDNIITTFLAGNAAGALCSNAGSVLGGESGSSNAATATSAAATSQASTSSMASTTASASAPTTSSSAVLSGTATATSLAPSTSTAAAQSSSGILVDTSRAPTASSTTSSSGSSQTDQNDGSGGGSPFDNEGNTYSLASVSTTCSLTGVLITTAMILFTTLR